MLRIAVQAKGRLFEETMALLEESDIKLSTTKRTLLVQSSNFPIEVLFLRDDDIPQTVATGVADLGIVGENEFMEKEEDAEIVKRLGFSKCRLSLAMPKDIEYPGLSWFEGKKIATSYPVILRNFLKKNSVNAEIHVITGSVEVSPGIGLADAIFDIVSSGSTLVSNRLKEVEVVMKSEALLIGNKNMSEEKKEVLEELLFRMNAVKTAEDKKYVLMNAPKDKLEEIIAVLPGMKSPTVMPLPFWAAAGISFPPLKRMNRSTKSCFPCSPPTPSTVSYTHLDVYKRQFKVLEIKQSVFADNDRQARLLRAGLKEKKVFLLNLMSSPGSGKTTTLARTIEALRQELRIGVMEADIDSDVDARTISALGVKAIQLHTGGMCHLDAEMTRQGPVSYTHLDVYKRQ